MSDPRTDRIAREAARLLGLGCAGDIAAAIRSAADALGLAEARMPSHGRVRRHAQAMSMQALGQAGYIEQQKKALGIAEQLMAACEHALPESAALLVGRAATGEVDLGSTIHIRLYTRASIPQITQQLVALGYEDLSYKTIETRYGRMNQIRLLEEGVEIALTRCPPELRSQANTDLFSGKPIEAIDLRGLRRQ